MSETRLANQLREKYQQLSIDEMTVLTSEDLEQQTATRVLKVDREDQVARELESIKKTYAQLVMSAESALETANPSPRQLKMRMSDIQLSEHRYC